MFANPPGNLFSQRGNLSVISTKSAASESGRPFFTIFADGPNGSYPPATSDSYCLRRRHRSMLASKS